MSFTSYLQKIFPPETHQYIDELTDGLMRKFYPKGAHLLDMGMVCQHSFFVVKGLLRAYTIDDTGKEHIIQFAPENWIISDRSSLYFDEPSEVFIQAIEDSEVILLDKDFFVRAGKKSSAIQTANELLLQRHIRYMQKRINLLLGATAETRYLEFVRMYPDMLLRVPQWMIASYLGITPESLSRVRKELAERHQKNKGK